MPTLIMALIVFGVVRRLLSNSPPEPLDQYRPTGTVIQAAILCGKVDKLPRDCPDESFANCVRASSGYIEGCLGLGPNLSRPDIRLTIQDANGETYTTTAPGWCGAMVDIGKSFPPRYRDCGPPAERTVVAQTAEALSAGAKSESLRNAQALGTKASFDEAEIIVRAIEYAPLPAARRGSATGSKPDWIAANVSLTRTNTSGSRFLYRVVIKCLFDATGKPIEDRFWDGDNLPVDSDDRGNGGYLELGGAKSASEIVVHFYIPPYCPNAGLFLIDRDTDSRRPASWRLPQK